MAIASLIPNAIFAQSNKPISINTHNLSQEYSSSIKHWYYKIGDDSTWTQQNSDSTRWISLQDFPPSTHQPGIQWYRTTVYLEGIQDEYDVLAISADNIVSAFELYWDGQLLLQNGVVANSREKEIPGRLKNMIKLKREMTTPGEHVIAIRLSNFHTKIKRPLGYVSIGYHYDFLYSHTYKGSHFLFVGGGLLFAGLFCIAMFFAGSRHRAYPLFALYCFITLFYQIYPMINLYNTLNIESLKFTNIIIRYGILISQLSLIIFFIYTFELKRKLTLVTISIGLTVLVYWLAVSFGSNFYFLYNELLPIVAGGILIYSIQQKKTGSGVALIGLVVWRLSKRPDLFAGLSPHAMYVYIIGDIVLLFCIVLAIARIINAQTMMLQEIKLRSSRLEVDLLKKNIQPHFILNTLQSIMSWIKKKPENAFQLIEALAEEFKMINRISDKKTIPLHQEIELCNTHLKIMGFRMGSNYELVSDGLCDDEPVPPMIFHTLIENALTHSFKTQESGSIKLSCERKKQATTYHLTNNGSRLKEVAKKSSAEIQEGMGLKYIKARLQESFPGKWKLDYTLDNDQWNVMIVIVH
ncbi:histidine kinase [bacterium]|nr:histidine kinase [bacterium]